MEMTKEELERKVRELTASIETFTNDADLLKKDLAAARQRLAVVNKPKITQDQMTEIQDAIHTVVGNIDFTDCNNYDMDFEIDYDNRIAVSNMEFNNSHEIADDISSEIECLFNVIQPEDEN
jgi:hypothetical protein